MKPIRNPKDRNSDDHHPSTHHPGIIITGASRGIGAATARLLAVQGYAIGVNYLKNAEAAREVAKSISDLGGKALCLQADVSSASQVESMFEQADQELGPLVGLVNNAAILETQMPLVDMDEARLDRIFATNVKGSFLCAKAAIMRMSTNQGGRGGVIVNVSSAAARLGSAREYIDYAASKGAIDTMTKGLANEVADEGIRVNAVRPGFIETDMHASGGEPDRLERVRGSIPLKRSGTAEEVAHAIAWLISPESSYCTGSFIDIAGGR